MPLLKDDKKKLVTFVMKRMKGSEDMSPNFGNETAEPVHMKDGAEQDCEAGYEACVTDMMSAFKENDKSKFKSSLKSFISMVMDEGEISAM